MEQIYAVPYTKLRVGRCYMYNGQKVLVTGKLKTGSTVKINYKRLPLLAN